MSDTPQAGPATPAVEVATPAAAGPALRAYTVDGAAAAAAGPAIPVVVMPPGTPSAGNAPIPIKLAAPGASALGQAPIPIVIVNAEPFLSAPSFAQQNTAFTNSMGPDGYSWPQAGRRGPIGWDSFGKLFALSEDVGGNHTITYSNDGGVTWADGPTLGFLTRGALDYNSADDRLEVLWLAQAATDGMLYRRYQPTRDGSNNITGWTAIGGGYCILDAQTSGTMEYQHPTILWLSDVAYGAHGAVVCLWAARNTGVGGIGNEIRAAMRILTNTADDLNPANWTHLGVNSTTTIGNAPGAASYTALLANATTGVPHVALLRLANKDLFVAYHDGTVTLGKMTGSWAYRRATWAPGSNNWTALAAAQTIATIVRAGADTGYANKGELLSKIVEDAAGNAYVGIATWKSNADGDTWGYAHITPADAVSLVDSYSAAGAHSYAPTGDVEYDATAQRVIASYIKTATQAAYVRLYNGLAPSQPELLAFNSAPVDIPLIRSRLNGKLLMLFRDTNTPHKGWFGTLIWN